MGVSSERPDARIATPSPQSVNGHEAKPFVLVTMGMEHHPFDRLVRWVDGWLATDAGARVECLIQSGPAAPPSHAESVDFLEYRDLEDALARAAIVVCHAGPGSIMMAKWLGHRPIVVPRLARFGEVVDDHQVTFGRQLASEGDVVIAESEASLAAALDEAVAGPPPPRSQGPSLPMTEAVARLAELVEGLVSTSRRRAGR